MRERQRIISTLTTLLFFVILETICLLMISNNGVIQRYKIMKALSGAESSIWAASDRASAYFKLQSLNEDLIEENLQLKQQLEIYRSIAKSEKYDSVAVDPDFTYIQTRIIKNTTNQQKNYIVVDKGRANGVEEGMGVITREGIVGIVSSAGENYSLVISFLNAGQVVSAKILKTGEFGPMSWNCISTKKAILKEIPIQSDVALGDTIVSSGYSIMYPDNIPLGIVIDSEDINGVSQNLTVQLFENFNALERAYIVKNTRSEEINNLEKDAK